MSENGYIFAQDHPEPYEPTDWQLEDLSYLEQRDWSGNWSEMGCISGDAIITVLSKSGKVTRWRLDEAYLGFNMLHEDKRRNWKSPEPYKTLSFMDGRIRHNEILGISYSGKKSVIKLTLIDGKNITLTPDHEVLKKNPITFEEEWVEADTLTTDDCIVVKGIKGGKFESQTNKEYRTVKAHDHPRANIGMPGYYYAREHVVVANAPVGMVVHHKNEDRLDNRPENLEVMTLEEHSRLHALGQIATYDTPPVKIASIENAGEVDTYDVSMAAPYHSFVANDIVVHNCYKTTTALWLIERKCKQLNLDRNPRVLIVTTRGGKGTYFDAMPKTLPGWELFSLSPIGAGQADFILNGEPLSMPVEAPFADPPAKPTVIVATYHCFANRAKIRDLILARHYDFIVLDEAHRIKERDNQWTRGIKRLKGTYRHIMTGSGIINRPDELWSLLNFLNKSLFSSYAEFRHAFCDEYRDQGSGMTTVIGIKPGMEETLRKLRRTVGPRRVKNGPDGVFEGILSVPVLSKVPVELNPTQRRMYDEIKHELETLDQAGVPIYSANVLSQLNRLRQICVATPEKIDDYFDEKTQKRVQVIRLIEPSSKLDATMELLDGMEEHQKVVIFSCFKDPLDLLKVRLDKAKIPYLHMKSEHNDNERYKLWHDIWPNENHRVFMSTLQLGSESINLTAADTAIFLDRSWSPKDNTQGVGRVYRPGQTKIPHIIHINARKTTDQRIERTNTIKIGWFNTIFSDEEETAEDYELFPVMK